MREQIVEAYARTCKLDALAAEVLRLIVAESAVRGELGGKFSLRLPSQVTLEQQIKIARPLWKFLRPRREQAILQLEGIPGVGSTMASDRAPLAGQSHGHALGKVAPGRIFQGLPRQRHALGDRGAVEHCATRWP